MLLWILIIIGSVVLDQLTKLLVVNTMTLGESIPLIETVFHFTRVHNYGAAWGMLSDHRWVFILITGVAIIVLPFVLYRYRKLHFLFGFSLSLVIGGAIGNMIDRLFLGYVVDFLDFCLIDFPVFNVADICVTCGAALMFIYLAFIDKELFAEKPKKTTEAKESSDGTADNQDHSDKS